MQDEIEKFILLRSKEIEDGKRERGSSLTDDENVSPTKKSPRIVDWFDTEWNDTFMLSQNRSIRCHIREVQGTPIVEIRAYTKVRSANATPGF